MLHVKKDFIIHARCITHIPVFVSQHRRAAVVEGSRSFFNRTGLVMPRTLIDTNGEDAYIQLINTMPYPQKIFRNSKIGHVEVLEEPYHINVLQECNELPPTSSHGKIEVKLGKALNQEQKNEILELLLRFRDVFPLDKKLGSTNIVEHHINVGDHSPLRQQPYRVSQRKGE